MRETECVARVGGDEFAIVQSGIETPAEAGALARRIREAINAPYNLNGHIAIVNASVGIAMAPDDGDEPDVLIKNADLALYRAKADGRGTYRFFEPDMDARMQTRRTLELALRNALPNGEFELHYQPVVNLADHVVTSCEALIRWHHPERGMISPAEFIPVAEEIGLIVAARRMGHPQGLRGRRDLAERHQGGGQPVADPVAQPEPVAAHRADIGGDRAERRTGW